MVCDMGVCFLVWEKDHVDFSGYEAHVI
uniref:Uncharacterized protein n=1 Tax=Anguilla anguilla TaxID=7936 RepID=A0A0E9UMK9_ANGAN